MNEHHENLMASCRLKLNQDKAILILKITQRLLALETK